ncbi:membrane-associated, eicosanoid/glutathione metabolism protein [Catenaria anguillulae PL171]|uniref:Membrane-associated, eicosanoid/glutathione metabolism protein n=1 Tax=Catenaria anguillulae PL171 TaxID=765915 RepID=A0A1Y2HQU9_9FUNG|nr:membrane-associated, eicosanoid/glutathione metabolism protein [Catenaria anguillulae PL171]
MPMLPLTVVPIYASTLAVYSLTLTARVIKQRVGLRVSLGDGTQQFLLDYIKATQEKPNDAELLTKAADPMKSKYWPLLAAVRAHGNLFETAPLVLLLATMCELNDTFSNRTLHALLAAFTVARVAHAELGVLRPLALGKGRTAGMMVTLTTTIVCAGGLAAQWAGWTE